MWMSIFAPEETRSYSMLDAITRAIRASGTSILAPALRMPCHDAKRFANKNSVCASAYEKEFLLSTHRVSR